MRWRTGYPVALAVVIAGTVFAVAQGVSLLTRGGTSYPVEVVGEARGRPQRVALRGPEQAMTRGRLDAHQLLPLPAPEARWWQFWRASGPPADPLYRVASAAGVSALLDRARLSVQRGQREQALRLYQQLGATLPAERRLLVERASVLATFGDHAAAVRLLTGNLSRYRGDLELRLLAAHNAWWGRQPYVADSLVEAVLALAPGHPDAMRLRTSIRGATEPPLVIAQRWALEGGQPRDQLTLARAYVRERRYAEALRAFRLAVADSALATDTLLLEAAGVAAAADSLPALAFFVDAHRHIRPGDDEATLRLARAYAWRREYDRSLREYGRVRRVDPAVAFEIAQVLAWSGKLADAERRLSDVVIVSPGHAEAHKLRGDVAAWRGRWAEARESYERAALLQPALPGLVQAHATAEEALREERFALRGGIGAPDSYGVLVEGFSDSERFRWMRTSITRGFTVGTATLFATGQHNVFESGPVGLVSRNPGLSGRLDGSFALGNRARLDLTGGAETYAAVGTFPLAAARITAYEMLGFELSAEARHQIAATRVGSLASLQAGTTSDVFGLSAYGSRDGWSLFAQAETERLRSRVGDSRRQSASATVRRRLSKRFTAEAGVTRLTTSGRAPSVRGFGNLYWSPESYVEPRVGLEFRTRISSRLSAAAGASVGYGIVREREGDVRYGASVVPTAALRADVRYDVGRFNASVGVSYGGAIERWYRAASARVQGS